MTVSLQGMVKDGMLTFESPLPFSEGANVRVDIVPLDEADSEASADSSNEYSEDQFFTQPAFGMWADREEMKDSAAWVRKERARWRDRLERRD